MRQKFPKGKCMYVLELEHNTIQSTSERIRVSHGQYNWTFKSYIHPPVFASRGFLFLCLCCLPANSQIASIIGLFEADTYSWRSQTTPGITGLFNQYCLQSAADNLITCAPGDNTYDGVQTSVSLVSMENQFHSIYATDRGEWQWMMTRRE